MSTTGERLVYLAGSGGTAATLLLAIGGGATTGEALLDYSPLPTGTAAEHLSADNGVVTLQGLSYWTGSVWVEKPIKYWSGSAWIEKPLKQWNGSAWV